MNPGKDYRWLRSIHRYWILSGEMVPILLLMGGFFAAVVLLLFGARQLATPTLGAFFVVSFAAAMIHHLLFYRAIRCPICGHNPTRYKNGKNIPTSTACKRLQNMEICPNCNGKS